MLRYLDQIALSLRPTSVTAANGMLRQFAGFLTTEFPEINGLVDVDRHHVEAFKRHLGTRLGRNKNRTPLSPTRSGSTLGTLRTFFERVSEWDYPDAPTRVLIFNGDLPTPDDPLPKFLSDPGRREADARGGRRRSGPTVGRRDARPNRAPRRRVLRTHRRRCRVHERPALATRADRQTPQRPLRPAPPAARRATRRPPTTPLR